jgi:hypothetical protein
MRIGWAVVVVVAAVVAVVGGVWMVPRCGSMWQRHMGCGCERVGIEREGGG